MQFRCAGTSTGTVNGIGLSYEIFFSGCRHDCVGCQNSELQNFSYGYDLDTNDILEHLDQYSGFYNSIVFTGGDPVYTPKPLYTLANECKLPSILYTGFLFNEIPVYVRNVLSIIIDGPYKQELKSNFPASSNQKVYINNNRIIQEQLQTFLTFHPATEINYYAHTNNF